MGMLLFYASGYIELFQLNERVDGLTIPVSEGWAILYDLWPVLAFMFFLGIFVVLIIMKLWKVPESS